MKYLMPFDKKKIADCADGHDSSCRFLNIAQKWNESCVIMRIDEVE